MQVPGRLNSRRSRATAGQTPVGGFAPAAAKPPASGLRSMAGLDVQTRWTHGFLACTLWKNGVCYDDALRACDAIPCFPSGEIYPVSFRLRFAFSARRARTRLHRIWRNTQRELRSRQRRRRNLSELRNKPRASKKHRQRSKH